MRSNALDGELKTLKVRHDEISVENAKLKETLSTTEEDLLKFKGKFEDAEAKVPVQTHEFIQHYNYIICMSLLKLADQHRLNDLTEISALNSQIACQEEEKGNLRQERDTMAATLNRQKDDLTELGSKELFKTRFSE